MKKINVWISVIILMNCQLHTKTLEKIQALHKDIGNELMGIRKEFTAAQPKIYALLDHVDQMYNLAKISTEKKHILKIELKNKDSAIKKLQFDLSIIKNKLHIVETELDKSAQKFVQLDRELQTEKVQSAILSREKKELSQEKHSLQSQISNIKNEPGKNIKSDAAAENILKGLTEEEKTLLKVSQNLSLSSTSAPSSPR